MRSELESGATLGDVGPVLELTYPNGKRGRVRLRSVDDAAMLKMLLPLITDVLDPAELAGRMLTSAYAAPTDKGETMTETTDQDWAQEDERLAHQDAAAAEAARRALIAAEFRQREVDAERQNRLTEEQAASKAAQDRSWAIFSSMSRIKRDRERAARWRMEVELPSSRLRRERDAAIAAAVAQVTQELNDRYAAAIQQTQAAFLAREKKRR